MLGLIVFGKVLSFLRDIVISSQFGSTYQTDAYFAANNIPSIIFTAVISSYIVLLIPTYKKIQICEGKIQANIFVSRIINLLVIFSLVLSLLGFIFIRKLIFLVAPGFDVKTTELAVVIGEILVLSFPLSSATLVLSTISNANNKYYAPHIIPLTSSLIVILGAILFSDKYGIIVIAVAGVLAFVVQLLVQILISRKHFEYTIKTKIFDKNVKKMTWLLLPIFLGYSVDQINLLVNSIISSGLTEGSLSSLNYAQRLQATINGTLSSALITVIYPFLSKMIAENKLKELTLLMAQSLRSVFIILVPLITYLALYSKEFVSIVYYRGEFDELALNQTSSVFLFYAFNVLFISLREVLLRLYYVKNNTKIPFLTSALSLVINIGLSLVFVQYLEVAGLALANLIATLVSAFILFYLVSSKLSINLTINNLLIFFQKLIIPLLVFIVYSVIIFKFFTPSSGIFAFSLFFLVSVFVYLIILVLFKQKDATHLFILIKERLINF